MAKNLKLYFRSQQSLQIIFTAPKPESKSIHSRGSWPDVLDAELKDTDIKGCEALLEILELVRKIKAQDNLLIKSPIKLIEVKGIVLLKCLESDLKNVTSKKYQICFQA